MRFHFFTSRDVPGSTSTKDISENSKAGFIQKQIAALSDYRTAIVISALGLLLTLYSFIAYSFLEASSVLLFNGHYHTDIYKKNHNVDEDSIQLDAASIIIPTKLYDIISANNRYKLTDMDHSLQYKTRSTYLSYIDPGMESYDIYSYTPKKEVL